VLSVEDWAEIRRLHRAEGMPIKQVARVMGVSKNTVKRALAADGPPRYQRAARGSVVDAVEGRIRELLQAWQRPRDRRARGRGAGTKPAVGDADHDQDNAQRTQ
jgi:transposase